MGGRERVLGRKTIINRNHAQAGHDRDRCADRMVGFQIPDHPAAAVHVKDYRTGQRIAGEIGA